MIDDLDAGRRYDFGVRVISGEQDDASFSRLVLLVPEGSELISRVTFPSRCLHCHLLCFQFLFIFNWVGEPEIGFQDEGRPSPPS